MLTTARNICSTNRTPASSSRRGILGSCCLIAGLCLIGFWLAHGVRAGKAEAVAPAPKAASAETTDANDLLVLRFDNSLNGEGGETPTTATGTSFQPGVS